MYSFRRFALVPALFLLASFAAMAQSSNTSSSSAPATQDPAQAQPQAPPPVATQSGQASVQARIRARREQRRAQAIRDTYSHPYEVFVGGGYQRFTPGPDRQRATMYSWDAALTHYWNERLGVTLDGRGYYGTAYVGLNYSGLTRPAVSHYDVLLGPTYRFRMRPRYSLAGRVEGGVAMGNFTGDTSGFGSICDPQNPKSGCLLYSDGTTYALAASVIGEVNVTPTLSLRLAPEYFATGFGSTLQNDLGFSYGFVFRFGK